MPDGEAGKSNIKYKGHKIAYTQMAPTARLQQPL
jgi:hypothetical protein